MTYSLITLAKAEGLATLTLNQPDKLNAVSRKMIAEIKLAWEDIAADSAVRAILLTGAGRGFCAGADLSDPDRAHDADSGAALDKFFNPVIRTMRSIPKPIVAAVQGAAIGSGMLGPLIMGASFDYLGGYIPATLFFAAITFVSMPLVLFINRPPDPVTATATA